MGEKKKIRLDVDSVRFDDDPTASVEVCSLDDCVKIQEENSNFCKEHQSKDNA